MKNRKIILLILAAVIVLNVFPAAIADDGVQITLIHTNDIHSRIDGEASVAALAANKAAEGENVLILNAGDTIHGQPFATISRGESIVEIMNKVMYTAMTPGNHDFNYGLDRLLELSEKMSFPVLAANVFYKETDELVFEPYIIKEMSGVRVGVFGLATPETPYKTKPENVEAIAFKDPAPEAEKAVAALKEQGAQVIIAVTHLGIDSFTLPEHRSDFLAQTVEGIDVIVDGHSHTKLDGGMTVNNTLIVQTGEYLENIGVVELTVSGGAVTEKTAALLPSPDLPKDDEVLELIEKIKAENKVITEEVIGSTPVDLNGERSYVRTSETNLADIINDAILKETGADISIINGGSIRASIPAGEITKGDILAVLPFGNYVTAMDLTGANVLQGLEDGLAAYPAEAGGFLQVGGIRLVFDPGREQGERIVSITLEKTGEELDPEKTYRVATNDYLSAGGDSISLVSRENYNEYSALDEIVIAYIQSGGEISAQPKGRITVAAYPSEWAQEVQSAIDMGIVPLELQNGYANPITREEVCVLAASMLERAVGSEIIERRQFADTESISVQKMGGMGVVNGIGGGLFVPSGILSREQAATIAARLMAAAGAPLRENEPLFVDNSEISPWAALAAGQVSAAGIMNGESGGMFVPKGECTREQWIIILVRCFDIIINSAEMAA